MQTLRQQNRSIFRKLRLKEEVSMRATAAVIVAGACAGQRAHPGAPIQIRPTDSPRGRGRPRLGSGMPFVIHLCFLRMVCHWWR